MISPIGRERTTFRRDQVRALDEGVLETAQVTFLLFILIKADEITQKGAKISK